MARNVVGGLIQCSNPINDENAKVSDIADAMLEKHIPLIEEAAQKGVQILCLQEIFNGPYFCPSQDPKWCDIAEDIPNGPTCQRMAELAKKHSMVIVVPIYERAKVAGVYYNSAAVFDADGSYLGVYRKNHIPHTNQFWEKFFFKPGNLGYPVFDTPLLPPGWGLHLLRPPLPRRGPGSSACNGAEDGLQSRAPLWPACQPVPVEARATRPRRGQWLLHGLRAIASAPRLPGTSAKFYGHQLLRKPPRCSFWLPRAREDEDEARHRRARSGSHRRGPAHLAVLPRPPAGHLRRHDRAAALRRTSA